jgi:carboxymethylenebutenolidase
MAASSAQHEYDFFPMAGRERRYRENDVADLFPIASPGIPLWWGNAGDPLVVLVHDWYGRLPWLETVGAVLAREGFRVSVPDLYSGTATSTAEDAARLMTSLNVSRSLSELDDIIATARGEGSGKFGVVGFSMGGWLALLHAQGGAVDAVVAFYATLAPHDHGVVPCPAMLQFAEFDDWGKNEEPDDFIARLKEHGTPVIAHTYPGTQHSFANGSIPDLVNPRAAQLALSRTALFMREHLIG